MVTLVAGAVAVGIVSVCAIPFGCFISRKILKKKVIIPPEVSREIEIEEDVGVPNSILVINPVEVADEPHYQIGEIRSRSNNGRASRVEILVLVSNGSTRSTEYPSQGYITASGTSESSSSQNGKADGEAIEARRYSLQNLATGPATNRQNQPGTSSLPIAPRIREGENNQELRNSETTRFEITISGPFSKSGIAQFGEFKNAVAESSTPKSTSNSVKNSSENHEQDNQRSSFWRRASYNQNGKPKIFKTTRGIEVLNVEVIPGEELRRRRNLESQLMTEAEEDRNCGMNESRKSNVEAAGTSKKNGTKCDRGSWGLPSRFFETFRESTSFATV